MSKQSVTKVYSETSSHPPWYNIWFTVLTQPSNQIFTRFVTQNNISKRRAYDWAFIGSLGVASSIIRFIGPATPILPGEEIASPSLIYLSSFCGQGFGLAILLLFGFILITVLTQVVANILGGTGKRLQLAYVFATYFAPLGIITAILSFVPIIRYTVILVVIYGLILNVIAIKAVQRFSWSKAITCNTIVFMITLFSIISFYQFFNSR